VVLGEARGFLISVYRFLRLINFLGKASGGKKVVGVDEMITG